MNQETSAVLSNNLNLCINTSFYTNLLILTQHTETLKKIFKNSPTNMFKEKKPLFPEAKNSVPYRFKAVVSSKFQIILELWPIFCAQCADIAW